VVPEVRGTAQSLARAVAIGLQLGLFVATRRGAIHHHESDGWWAESPNLPSFFAAGETLEETKKRVREVLPKLTGGDYFSLMQITHQADVPPAIIALGNFEGSVRIRFAQAAA
jgi:predicted RNase H-like HicB family nuclease